jgi:hypothetical protein
MAVMLVARGQGLIAVISPSKKAVNSGKDVFSRRVVRYSMERKG